MIDQFEHAHNDDLKPVGMTAGIVIYEVNFEAQKAREEQAIRDSIARRLARENA